MVDYDYDDGRGVRITDDYFEVDDTQYSLGSIRTFKTYKRTTSPVPAIIVGLLGVMLLMASFIQLFPSDDIIETWHMSLNGLSGFVGTILVLMGIAGTLFIQTKHILKITTARLDREVIIDRNKRYVTKVSQALNQALDEYKSREAKREGKEQYERMEV